MTRAWEQPDEPAVIDIEAEAARILAMECELASLDSRSFDARSRLYDELFKARDKRIEREIAENWRALDSLVGDTTRR